MSEIERALHNDKGSIQRDCIEILNASALNTRAAIYGKQKPKGLKGEIDKSTIIAGDVGKVYIPL